MAATLYSLAAANNSQIEWYRQIHCRDTLQSRPSYNRKGPPLLQRQGSPLTTNARVPPCYFPGLKKILLPDLFHRARGNATRTME